MHPLSRAIAATVALALALAALAVGACGSSELDVSKAAKLIETAVRTQVGARVKSVKCPSNVPIEAKDTFTCTVAGSDGSKGEATVTQRDDQGNISVDAPFLHIREAEEVIAAELRKKTKGATVRCPEIVVVAKGGTFACQASGGGDSAKVAVEQTDDQGRFKYKLH